MIDIIKAAHNQTPITCACGWCVREKTRYDKWVEARYHYWPENAQEAIQELLDQIAALEGDNKGAAYNNLIFRYE